MDYRLKYLSENIGDENFKITDVGVNFTLEGDKGTKLEMKPHIPRRMVVDRGDSIIVITKNSMTVKNKKAAKAEQLKMDGIDNV